MTDNDNPANGEQPPAESDPNRPAADGGSGTPASGDDAQLRRLRVAAEELANIDPVERSFYLPRRAEELGVTEKELKSTVTAVLKKRSEENARVRLEQDRQRKAEQDRLTAEQKRHDDEAKAEQKRREAEAKAERDRLAAEAKAAERAAKQKRQDKAKGFGVIARLPMAQQGEALRRLGAQLHEDPAALRRELEELLGVGSRMADPEPWPEPVSTAELLDACAAKIRRHVVLNELLMTTAALWVAHCWLYDHAVPTHSPLLAATSAEPDSGKTTLVAVLGRMSPRFSLNIEMTGPSVYRMVDATKPTLVIDEADDLFTRKPDLKHIINAAWTKGATIPRIETINSVKVTVEYDPFTPKAIALLGRNLPPATRTRCIELRMKPKRQDEKAEDFNQLDDTEFATLRRKFFRWAADNHAALKVATPVVPENLNNRNRANWKLLLAIAELAGESWLQRTSAAAVRLTRKGPQPSDGVQLLAFFKKIFAGRKDVTSKEVEQKLATDDELPAWTKKQISILLAEYDIEPTYVGPKDKRARGYRAADFQEAFALYLPADPRIRAFELGAELEFSGDLSAELPSRKRKSSRKKSKQIKSRKPASKQKRRRR